MRKLLVALAVLTATPALAETTECEAQEFVYMNLCAEAFAPTLGVEGSPKYEEKLLFAATMCKFSSAKLKRRCDSGADPEADSCKDMGAHFQRYVDDACTRGLDLSVEDSGLKKSVRYEMCVAAYKAIAPLTVDLCLEATGGSPAL